MPGNAAKREQGSQEEKSERDAGAGRSIEVVDLLPNNKKNRGFDVWPVGSIRIGRPHSR